MIKTVTISALLIAVSTCCGSSTARAQAGSCGDLWFRRNAIYKSAGYCFHTQRGIRAFGNAGCAYDDVEAVPLSPLQRRIVADIVAEERDMACR